MAEAVHGALGLWQAGRADEAWNITKGSLLAAMFMGISPGNVGSMSYLDVYRRESQRDFADGSGVLSRALIEGLFGVRSQTVSLVELLDRSGFSPRPWDHGVELHHPDVDLVYRSEKREETFQIDSRFPNSSVIKLEIQARGKSARVVLNGVEVAGKLSDDDGSMRKLIIAGTAGARHTVIKVSWDGATLQSKDQAVTLPLPWERPAQWNEMKTGPHLETIDLTPYFNDRVTQIFRNEYRSPRSPFVSLALPKQGLGGWAGGVNATAEIDDSGLRAVAGKNVGRLTLPNGLPFTTPGPGEAKNIVFTSQWDNYPREVTIPLIGKARRLYLLMAGSTNPMQSRVDNGEVIVNYRDGRSTRLALENPTTWWPIEQDYFVDDFQFRRDGPLPVRVDLKTGSRRTLDEKPQGL